MLLFCLNFFFADAPVHRVFVTDSFERHFSKAGSFAKYLFTVSSAYFPAVMQE